ncbi:MAG: 1-pyrroline-5-carboxylate dehydrogenase [Acidobacteria bacterium RIFCSPLOWO2_02_FULL_67_36]|nr:MAG: 1-pyrroline-5-carboxylate dehydrogenase [Acidobacteria bacterium RIFCSPLOWO2_02_FULL_67_36]OFW21072.1 MAG: 1-pyrroline-5-carboxylate dehydrogenase [Acidobacteria bacterium RIFCSPLOWO2_12_FULL_66_21]
MTTQATQRITYATMSADPNLHTDIDAAVERVKGMLGKTHPMYIDGKAVTAGAQFEDRSPIDTRIVLGTFQQGGREHVQQAVAAARAAFPAWSGLPWQERVRLLKKVADTIRAHRFDLAVLMIHEVGKNRLECLGDVIETADLIEYYCDEFANHGGYELKMDVLGPNEQNMSVMRPYGVFGVISPFNFPMALAGGPAGGALVAGNTVVFKPATDTPLMGAEVYEMMAEAGLPHGVFNFITGPGRTAGQEIIDNEGIDGIVFTGSMEVGMKLLRDNGARRIPRPVIIEMGGKNPAIITSKADIDKATDGVYRSAFGAQGQKCSACSRVYVSTEVRAKFIELLVEKTKKIKIGNPLERDVWMGPVVNEGALKTYEEAVARARRDGGRILAGGNRITAEPYNHGYFVEPTLIDGLPKDHSLFKEELFVPITVIGEVTTLDEAIDLANATEYGLTAGIFSEDDAEIEKFFNRIQAGTTYANRRSGATTGAWPGINPFGGWKASGSTGRGTGGPWYVQQFMHEQSRVRIR